MTAKMPPVPAENRSKKGVGDQGDAGSGDQTKARGAAPNPDKQGQQANTKVNTTHQGYQQDR